MILLLWSPLEQRFVSYSTQLDGDSKLTSAVKLVPSLVDYFVTITARLRWDEANELPQTRVSLRFVPRIFTNLIRFFFSSGSLSCSSSEELLKWRKSKQQPAS